jgi:hypothetical protein
MVSPADTQGCSDKTISAYESHFVGTERQAFLRTLTSPISAYESHFVGTERQAFLRTNQTPCSMSPSSQSVGIQFSYFCHPKDPKYKEM